MTDKMLEEGLGSLAPLVPAEQADGPIVGLIRRLEARTVTTTESGPGGAFHYVIRPDEDCQEAAALIREITDAS